MVSEGLFLGVGVSHEGNRNNLALHVSKDGQTWVHGTTISAETDGTDFVHYADIVVNDSKAYVLYSEEDSQATSPAPNEIRFARLSSLPAADKFTFMTSSRNYYELGSGTVPSFSGNNLVIPPQMGASAVIEGDYCEVSLKFNVDTVPNSSNYVIASVGDSLNGFMSVEIPRRQRNRQALC